jgi:hypothetical protein
VNLDEVDSHCLFYFGKTLASVQDTCSRFESRRWGEFIVAGMRLSVLPNQTGPGNRTAGSYVYLNRNGRKGVLCDATKIITHLARIVCFDIGATGV